MPKPKQMPYEDLYDEMVDDQAYYLSKLVQLSRKARNTLDKIGVDPYSVLDDIQCTAYECIKDALRPGFLKKAEELGLKGP